LKTNDQQIELTRSTN